MKTKTKNPNLILRVKPTTRQLIDTIREAKGWNILTTAERVFTEFAVREGIKLPDGNGERSGTAA